MEPASFAVAWLIHPGVERPSARPPRPEVERSLTDRVDLHEPFRRSVTPAPAPTARAGDGVVRTDPRADEPRAGAPLG